MGRTVNKGVDVYHEWHDKDPTKLTSIKVDLPVDVGQMGKVTMIAYRSGKWLKSGKTEDYEHPFESGPFIYHEDGDGRLKQVSSMIRQAGSSEGNPKGLPVLIDLGKCIELTLETPEGGEDEIILRGAPKLCCTPDKKTLVILHSDGPLFIKGGRMRVTNRGIVG